MSSNRNNAFVKIFILISLWSIEIFSFGQANKGFSVSGSLIDSLSKKPLEYASIAIYKVIDNSLVTGAITNITGAFTINNLPAGKFIIKCSFVGYVTKTTNIEIRNVSVVLPQPIMMNSASLSLGEVQVIGKQNEKQITIEKTKINVAQNISAVSGNVTDVLKNQSSITIDADNNIYLRGSGNILILMDGKPTTISALNSIPASSIESVDIVTNPDVKYDAEGTGGIINIVMKRQSVSGMSGAMSLNYGFNNRINGGLNFNLKKGIWDVGFSYNGKYERANIHSNLTRQLYSQSTIVEQEINSVQISPTQVAGLSISAKPTEKDLITFGLRVLYPDLTNTQNISGRQLQDILPVTFFNRRNEIAFSRKVVESSLSYRKIFEKNRNEISFDAFYSRTKGSRPAEYYIEDQLLQKSSGGGTPTNATIQVDYFKSLFQRGRLETGLKVFSRWNSFNYNFYDLDTITNEWIKNPVFSNDLEHKEYIYSGYLMYSDSLSKKLFYKIGARLEYNTTDLIQKSINEEIYNHYLFPFPYLLLTRNINKAQSLALSINRRVTRPTYMQLNPFINVIDQTTYETGNKNLKPEISDKVEFNYTVIKEKYQFRSNLYSSSTKDFITQVSSLSPPDNLIMTYVNGNGLNKIGADIDYVYKFNKVFSVNPAFSVFYSKSTGYYNEIDLSVNNFAWTGNIKTTIKPDQKTDIQILLNYNSPVALPQFNLGEIYYADVAIKRSFMKNKLALSLSLTDVFNTRKWIITSDNTSFGLYNSSKNETRIFWIGITYNINSFKSKAQNSSGNETDNTIIKLGQ
jgi:outer membrane receptor protein involved in Fe transport